MNKKMLLIISTATAVIGIILTTNILAFNEKPWAEMTCEQMKDYAIEPKHFKLSDTDHMEFHMAIDKCTLES